MDIADVNIFDPQSSLEPGQELLPALTFCIAVSGCINLLETAKPFVYFKTSDLGLG